MLGTQWKKICTFLNLYSSRKRTTDGGLDTSPSNSTDDLSPLSAGSEIDAISWLAGPGLQWAVSMHLFSRRFSASGMPQLSHLACGQLNKIWIPSPILTATFCSFIHSMSVIMQNKLSKIRTNKEWESPLKDGEVLKMNLIINNLKYNKGNFTL
jgi:hypothetical protein